jgi:hypothetical protein
LATADFPIQPLALFKILLYAFRFFRFKESTIHSFMHAFIHSFIARWWWWPAPRGAARTGEMRVRLVRVGVFLYTIIENRCDSLPRASYSYHTRRPSPQLKDSSSIGKKLAMSQGRNPSASASARKVQSLLEINKTLARENTFLSQQFDVLSKECVSLVRVPSFAFDSSAP